MRNVISLAIIATFTVASAIFTPSAQATEKYDHADRLVLSVLTSANPMASAASIPAAERQAFQSSLDRNVRTIREGGHKARQMSLEQAKGAGLDASRASSGCWYDYESSGITVFGVSVGRIYMQLNWCGNGSQVTSYNARPYGCIGQNGFTCDEQSVLFRNVGYEVRALGRYRFTIAWASSTRCAQIRGGAGGLYSTNTSCVL
jgi:hypothetical protein